MRDSPSQFIEGARNSANPWGVVPDVLGHHRMVPPYAAQPFTSAAGSSQYLHLMFAWSPGNLAIDDYRIGETPLGNYYGRHGRRPCTGRPPTTRRSSPGSTPTTSPRRRSRSCLTQAAGYQQRTTATEAAEISIDLTLPQGLVQFDAARQPAWPTASSSTSAIATSAGPSPRRLFTGRRSRCDWIVVEGDHVRITFEGMQTSALRHSVHLAARRSWPSSRSRSRA